MKATLNYLLPDDNTDFACALAGKDALFALADINRFCRSILKHQDPPPAARAAVQAIQNMIPIKLLEVFDE